MPKHKQPLNIEIEMGMEMIYWVIGFVFISIHVLMLYRTLDLGCSLVVRHLLSMIRTWLISQHHHSFWMSSLLRFYFRHTAHTLATMTSLLPWPLNSPHLPCILVFHHPPKFSTLSIIWYWLSACIINTIWIISPVIITTISAYDF